MKVMKGKRYMFLCISLMIVSLVACGTKENELADTKQFDAEHINEIYVKTVGENIKLYSTVEKNIKIDTGDTEGVKVKADGDKLEIIIENAPSIVNLKTATVQIYLPKKIYKKIDVETESGEVIGENMSSKKLDLYSDSSDMTIKNYKGDQMEGVSESGGITLQEVEGSFDIQTNTGEINVTTAFSVKNESKIKTESSHIHIKLEKEPENLEVDLSTQAGKIENDFSLSSVEKGNSHKVKGRIGTGQENDAKLTVESMTGTITLKRDK